MSTGEGLAVYAVELVRLRMPLVTPFRTSFGSQAERVARAGEAVALGLVDVRGLEKVVQTAGVKRLYEAGGGLGIDLVGHLSVTSQE